MLFFPPHSNNYNRIIPPTFPYPSEKGKRLIYLLLILFSDSKIPTFNTQTPVISQSISQQTLQVTHAQFCRFQRITP